MSNFYGYIPSMSAALAFDVLFFATTCEQLHFDWETRKLTEILAAHLMQSMQYKMWWTVPTFVLAGLGEFIGWVGRTVSASDASYTEMFHMQCV